MGKKTIYVKNEGQWEAAKSIAGVDGMSSFLEEALQRHVTAKRLDSKGLQMFSLPVEPPEHLRIRDFNERLGFQGKCLVNWGAFAVYLTKGGTFIVADSSLDEDGSISTYRTYTDKEELRQDMSIVALDQAEHDSLWERISDALPPPVTTTWIE